MTQPIQEKQKDLAAILLLFKTSLCAILDSTPDAPPLYHGRQKWLSVKCEISKSTAGKWLSGMGMPDWDNMLFLADQLDTTVDELLGRKPIAIKKSVPIPIRSDAEDQNSIFGNVAFEDGVLETAMNIRQEGVELIVVSTDSMAPDININDIVFMNTKVQRIEENKIYMFSVMANNRILIRKTLLDLDGTVRLVSTNTNYNEIRLPLSEICCTDAAPQKCTLELKGEITWLIKKL